MIMDWDKLKVFHAAAVAGSFRTPVSGSACLSRRCRGRYRRWSGKLGVSLFHRHAPGSSY